MQRDPSAAPRLTPNETAVLGLLGAANGPLTAYQLLGRMQREGAAVAPPTVYRALRGLERAGLARRIETLHAWTATADPAPAVVAICDDCGSVRSVTAPDLFRRLSRSLAAEGFVEGRRIVEVHGRCGDCRGAGA